MTDFSDFNRVNKEEALDRLFTKQKYDTLLHLWPKAVAIIKQNPETVMFNVNGQQKSFPALLVKAFTNIRTKSVRLEGQYSMNEIENLFEIMLNLPEYKCLGITKDYNDWKSVKSLHNMIELAEKFGMTEVKLFLQKLPDLFTSYNKNAYEIELQRRQNQSKDTKKDLTIDKEKCSNPPSSEKQRQRSRSRNRSITRFIKRSLSRGRKKNDD